MSSQRLPPSVRASLENYPIYVPVEPVWKHAHSTQLSDASWG